MTTLKDLLRQKESLENEIQLLSSLMGCCERGEPIQLRLGHDDDYGEDLTDFACHDVGHACCELICKVLEDKRKRVLAHMKALIEMED